MMNQAFTANTLQANEEKSALTPIKDFDAFYKFYLGEHQNIACRRLHFLGTSAGIYGIYKTLRTGKKRYIVRGIVTGYACAWVGHFFFEKNKPASFKQPLYSFISDWRMFADIVKGNISLKSADLDKIEY